MNEPSQVIFRLSRLLIDHFTSVFLNCWRLLYYELFKLLDFLAEIAFAGVVADYSNLVFYVFALQLDRLILKQIIQSQFVAALLRFLHFLIDSFLIVHQLLDLLGLDHRSAIREEHFLGVAGWLELF